MVHGGGPLLLENLAKRPTPLNNADVQSILARSASAVTPSEKVETLRCLNSMQSVVPLVHVADYINAIVE